MATRLPANPRNLRKRRTFPLPKARPPIPKGVTFMKGGAPRGSATTPASLPTYAWAPIDIAGAELYIDARVPEHLWQQIDSSTSPAITRVSAATDPVGRVGSPVHGHVFRALGDSARPTYRTGAARFEFDGSADYLVLHNSQSAMSFIHETCVCTIAMHVGVRADGAIEPILSNESNTTTNLGIQIRRTAANVLQITVRRNVSGTSAFSYTTTAQLTAAMGVVPVEIRLNNASGGDVRINGGALETFARSNAPGAGDATADLTIGRYGGAATYGEVDLQDLLITNTVVSDADLTLWREYTPAISTYLRQVALPEADGDPCFNFCHRWHDFTDSSTLWQDTGRSVAVASNNDPIRVADHKLDVASPYLNRHIQAGSDAARPLYLASGEGADFDGTDDSLALATADAMGGGARTWIFVLRNDDATNGSRFTSGSNYSVATGADYSGNPGGIAYVVPHCAGGGTGPAADLGTESGYNVIAFRRDGSAWQTRARGAGVTNDDSGTQAEGFTISAFGTAASADWFMDGRIAEIVTYQIDLSDAELDVEIERLLAKHTGLSL